MKMKIAIVFLWRGALGAIASLAILGAASAADAPQSPAFPAFTVTTPALHPSWKGIKQFGSAEEEQGYASALDDHGNLYVTGYTAGDFDGTGPEVSAGSYDVYVMKLNSNGQVQWIRQIGSPDDDRAHAIAVDHRGHVYVTGHTDGDLDYSGPEVNEGEGDPFLVKLDEDGQVQWIRQFGTPGDDIGFSVAVDALDHPYVAGFTSDDMDGAGSGTHAGNQDIFLTKFDGAGNKLWVRQIGSPDDDDGYAVTIDAHGYVYVTGFSLGDLDDSGPQVNAGAWDIIALKYDGRGNLKWIRQFGTPGDDWGYAVATDRDRHLYIGGYVSGDLDGDGPDVDAGGADIAILKMKDDGDVVWSRQLGTAGHDIAHGVSVDQFGDLYVTGYTSGDLDGPGPQIYQGATDVAVLKLDRDGTTERIRQLGTPGYDLGLHVLSDRKQWIYITGQTDGDLDGPGPETHAGDFDLFLLKFRVAKVKSLQDAIR